MTLSHDSLLGQMAEDGFVVLPGIFMPNEVETIRNTLHDILTTATATGAIRSESGELYAARNILTLWPEAGNLWLRPRLMQALAELLGPHFGLVRVLYFDKPPDRTWSLPWHKDLTIAVRDNRLPSRHFLRPTTKAGVPHVEAPLEVLEQMLTARIHLDDVTEENGPLRVIPGSHRSGKELQRGEVPPRRILVQRGDVLLMRPLLAHCSDRSHPETRLHRRILHLEFASDPELPDDYAWHEFLAPKE